LLLEYDYYKQIIVKPIKYVIIQYAARKGSASDETIHFSIQK